MSLLMDALKKAENAKRAGQSGSAPPAPAGPPTIWPKLDLDPRPAVDLDAELGLRPDTSPPAPVTTGARASAPTAPATQNPAPAPEKMELAIEPRADPAAAAPAIETAAPQPAPASTNARASRYESSPADQKTARSVFTAKRGASAESSRRPFYVTLGVLLLAGAGATAYFWMELQAPPAPSLAIRQPPAPAVAPPAPSTGATAAPTAAPAAARAPNVSAPVSAPTATPPPSPPSLPEGPRTAPGAPPPAMVAAAPQSHPAAQEPAVRAPRPVAGGLANAASAQGGAPVASPSNLRISRDRRTAAVDPGVAAGYDALAAGNLDEAREHYSRALSADPASRDALLGLATIALRSGRTENAEALFQKVLEAHPRDSYALAQLATLKSDPATTESRVKNLLARENDPAGAAALQFTLGSQLAAQGRWAEAQQAFFNAFAADPENPDYCYNLAVSLDQIHQPRPAREHYLRAAELAATRKAAFDVARARARAEQLAAASR